MRSPSALADGSIHELRRNDVKNDKNITVIVVPEGITVLPDGAFQHYIHIKEIRLPKSMTNIPDYAFVDCWNLENVNIPDNVTYIGKNAFQNCSSIALESFSQSFLYIKKYVETKRNYCNAQKGGEKADAINEAIIAINALCEMSEALDDLLPEQSSYLRKLFTN